MVLELRDAFKKSNKIYEFKLCDSPKHKLLQVFQGGDKALTAKFTQNLQVPFMDTLKLSDRGWTNLITKVTCRACP